MTNIPIASDSIPGGGPASGTTAWSPPITDLVIDAFERCGLSATQLETKHLFSARRSSNFVCVRFANRGVNLWRVDATPTLITLTQGVSVYPLPSDTVTMLDTYRRQYQLGAAVNLTPAFLTTLGYSAVTVTQADNGAVAGNFIQIAVPVAIGGLVLYGFYAVQSVTGTDTYTILASATATSSASGGVVPLFTTAIDSSSVTVTLANHGYLSGQLFSVQVSTLVGGITLSPGPYTITSVTAANTFVINAGYSAGTVDSQYENDGQTQISSQATQGGTAAYTDIIMTPLSRNDYAAIPNKATQAQPTTYWFNKQISPFLTVWPAPDQNGPYQIQTYLMRQIEDVNPVALQTMNLPYRFGYAFVAALAADLAIKWAADRAEGLKAVADEAWIEASDADREAVSLFLLPDFSAYGT